VLFRLHEVAPSPQREPIAILRVVIIGTFFHELAKYLTRLGIAT
jgi:hypothetical protein